MANTKPDRVAEWNSGLANQTEPSGGKKILGWVLDEAPSSSFWNWLHFQAFRWFRWFNERFDDGLSSGGGDEEDLWIHPPVPATDGGELHLTGATAVNGSGGAVKVFGGSATTSGSGGVVTVQGGVGAAGVGGGALVAGGIGAGTDQDSGDATVTSGISSGSGSGDVIINATEGGASGAAARFPTEYLRASGANSQIEASKPVVISADTSSPDQSALRVVPQDAEAASPAAGDLNPDQGSGLWRTYSGAYSAWHSLVSAIKSAAGALGNVVNTAVATTFSGANATIPAGSLRVGSIIRVRCGGPVVGSLAAQTLTIGLTTDVIPNVAAAQLIAFTNNAKVSTVGPSQNWYLEATLIVSAIGAGGSWEIAAAGGIGSATGLLDAQEATRPGHLTKSVDTTGVVTIYAYADWAAASVSNDVEMRLFEIDVSL